MAVKQAILPFLLPRPSLQWQPILRSTVRYASNKPDGQIVLEKPAKFNPPSHGSKLRRPGGPKIVDYGPQLSKDELAAQQKKKYPTMMPPEETFLHWFLTSRGIHAWISLGVLGFLTIYTLYMSLKQAGTETGGEYVKLLPPLTSLFLHPIKFFKGMWAVLKLRTAEHSAETYMRREEKLEDAIKAKSYRKAHGLEKGGFWEWSVKGEEEMSISQKQAQQMRAAQMEAAMALVAAETNAVGDDEEMGEGGELARREKMVAGEMAKIKAFEKEKELRPERKKYWGIF